MSAISCEEVRDLADAYALQTLEPSVEYAIRAHLEAHPDGHPEFAEFAEIVPALAYLTDPVAPPVGLKARVLASVATSDIVATRPSSPASADTPSVAPARTRWDAPTPLRGWRRIFTARRAAIAGWTTALVAIAVVIALVASGWQAPSGPDNNGLFGRLQRAVQLAAMPGSRVALIGAVPSPSVAPAGSPAGVAVIPRSGSGILVIQGLSETSGRQVYEAWAIVGRSAPAPIGSFSVGRDRVGWLDALSVPPGENLVVALTLEPGPGATTPTLPIIVAGPAQ
jgi:hypothetical protein